MYVLLVLTMHTFPKVILPQRPLKGDVSSLSLLSCKDSPRKEIITINQLLIIKTEKRNKIKLDRINRKADPCTFVYLKENFI